MHSNWPLKTIPLRAFYFEVNQALNWNCFLGLLSIAVQNSSHWFYYRPTRKKNCLKHILRIQHLLKVELVCFDPILSMSDSIFPTTQGKINTFCACSIKDVWLSSESHLDLHLKNTHYIGINNGLFHIYLYNFCVSLLDDDDDEKNPIPMLSSTKQPGLALRNNFSPLAKQKKAKNPHPSILFWKNKKTNPKTLLSQLKF